jgi:large subunit ribosomal protein L4e
MSHVYNLTGQVKEKVELPKQFKETYRPDLIRRAVLALQSHKMQPYGTKIGAGTRNVVYLSKRRHEYRGTYGIGQSRTPSKTMSHAGSRFQRTGANVPQAVGGRQAHPPRVEKIFEEKINKKERKKAIRSALNATTIKAIVEGRGHRVSKVKELPIIITNDIEKIKKTAEVEKLLDTLGLGEELERVSEKKVRAGRGKRRGRVYKKKVGPLFIVSKKCELSKSAKNIAGADVSLVKDINTELLAPGTKPGRLTIWSEDAIKLLGEKNLFM